jgi:hypothetical protein
MYACAKGIQKSNCLMTYKKALLLIQGSQNQHHKRSHMDLCYINKVAIIVTGTFYQMINSSKFALFNLRLWKSW